MLQYPERVSKRPRARSSQDAVCFIPLYGRTVEGSLDGSPVCDEEKVPLQQSKGHLKKTVARPAMMLTVENVGLLKQRVDEIKTEVAETIPNVKMIGCVK